MQSILEQVNKFWLIIATMASLIWGYAILNNKVSNLEISDTNQNLKIEAINTDITSIKVDTSYIRARIDGQIPPQK